MTRTSAFSSFSGFEFGPAPQHPTDSMAKCPGVRREHRGYASLFVPRVCAGCHDCDVGGADAGQFDDWVGPTSPRGIRHRIVVCTVRTSPGTTLLCASAWITWASWSWKKQWIVPSCRSTMRSSKTWHGCVSGRGRVMSWDLCYRQPGRRIQRNRPPTERRLGRAHRRAALQQLHHRTGTGVLRQMQQGQHVCAMVSQFREDER